MKDDNRLLFHRIALRVVRKMSPAGRGHALLVTSARAGEGKTYIAEGLADALSQQGLGRIALVECSPSAQPGARAGSATLASLIMGTATEVELKGLANGSDGLQRIAYGAGDDATLYRVNGVARTLDALRSRFTMVVLDGPTVNNCAGLTDCVDGSLLVINATRTRREIVKGSLQSNSFGGAKLLGAVLNEMPQHVPRWLYRRAQ